MAYRRGTVHALSVSGIIAIEEPVGLSVLLTHIPNWIGLRYSEPIDYFRAGFISTGNADGFMPDQMLAHLRTLFYPLPPNLTLLGVTLADGVEVEVLELWAMESYRPDGQLGLAGLGGFQLGRAA